MLSQHLRVAHRFETAQKTLSGSLSVSVCSLQVNLRFFLESDFLLSRFLRARFFADTMVSIVRKSRYSLFCFFGEA